MRHLPLWIFSYSVIFFLVLPWLIRDSMFMDAALDTSVAHNLSKGTGTLWFLKFNPADHGAYQEKPPLFYWIQAFFFTILGSSLYVERFYVLLTLLITSWLTVKIWKLFFSGDDKISAFGWFPLILWILIPVCWWSFRNNMIENTMGIFILSAILFTIKAHRRTGINRIFYFILSGIFIFLATFTKGLPGLFPLAITCIYWIAFRNTSFRKALLFTVIQVFTVFFIYTSLLFFIPDSRESLYAHFFNRTISRITEAPTVDNQLWIFYRLFGELLPPILVSALSLILFKNQVTGVYQGKEDLKNTLFFILAGLAGSAPLALTGVQKGFYLVPSLPLFAIGFSIFPARLMSLSDRFRSFFTKRFYMTLSISLLLLSASFVITFLNISNKGREDDLLHDIHTTGKIIPASTTIHLHPSLGSSWTMQSYLVRYCQIGWDFSTEKKYYLIPKEADTIPPEGYEGTDNSFRLFHLYKKRDTAAE
ncbi:MAG: glycosyltransferase family 39 protein [Bacteroidetes bacterium]|nr:glycosyltransferase family 39 protein [Bacteroidota bacterium]